MARTKGSSATSEPQRQRDALFRALYATQPSWTRAICSATADWLVSEPDPEILWDPKRPDRLRLGFWSVDNPNGEDPLKNKKKVTAERFSKKGAYKGHSLRLEEELQINTDAAVIVRILTARYIETILPFTWFLRDGGWPHSVVANLLALAATLREGLLSSRDEAELERDRERTLEAMHRAFGVKE